MKPTTNNLEGWEERFNNEFGNGYYVGNKLGCVVNYDNSVIKQFISELRKHDMDELIKMTELAPSRPELRESIKEYYNK